MAQPAFAEKGVTPLFEALRNSGQLTRHVHSWYLSANPDEQSEILMGDWDTTKFKESELHWHALVKDTFWAVKLDDILVDGVSTGFCTRPGANCTVCPDSGTSQLTFPQKHYSEWSEKYGDKVDCDESDLMAFPDLTFVIDGVHYNMPTNHWIKRKVNDTNPKGGFCESTIEPLDVGQVGLEEMHILGDAFMQLFYTIHDAEKNRVGFAPAIHNLPEVVV